MPTEEVVAEGVDDEPVHEGAGHRAVGARRAGRERRSRSTRSSWTTRTTHSPRSRPRSRRTCARRSPSRTSRTARTVSTRSRTRSSRSRPGSTAARRSSPPRPARSRRSSCASAWLTDGVRIDGRQGYADTPHPVGRGRGAAARARLRALRAWRDPDHGRHHAEHAPHGAADRLARSEETRKRYMITCNFPPYSTGETGRVGSPKRREIGPRRARRASPRSCRGSAPRPRGVPLRDPPGVRGPRLRMARSSHGLRVRLDALAPQRGRAAARPRRGHRDGPHLRHGGR